jgi:hypothetical protein
MAIGRKCHKSLRLSFESSVRTLLMYQYNSGPIRYRGETASDKLKRKILIRVTDFE